MSFTTNDLQNDYHMRNATRPKSCLYVVTLSSMHAEARQLLVQSKRLQEHLLVSFDVHGFNNS